MKINVYDFDETIYDGDSSVDFFFFCLRRNWKILVILPSLISYAVLFLFKRKTMTELVEKFFCFLKYVDNVDKEIKEFWKLNSHKIKKFYLEKDHSNDVIISASPEFLLKPICDKLKVKLLIGSVVSKKTGKFTGKNCHDHEKVKRLKKVYKNVIVSNMYTDSYCDKPLIDISKNAYYVRKNKITRIK